MPEGDTIFRAARTLAGQTVTRSESVFPRPTRVDTDHPIAGRLVERVEARGKHMLIWFQGSLGCGPIAHERVVAHLSSGRALATAATGHADRDRDRGHPRCRLQRPGGRVLRRCGLDATQPLRELGPDPLRADFDPEAAIDRLGSGQQAVAVVGGRQ